MRKYISPLILTIVLFQCSQQPYDPISQIKTDITILAHDSLKGREVGTQGEKMAADYIISELEKSGIAGKGTDGFLQSFFVKNSNNPHENVPVSNADGEEGITGYNVVGMIDNPGEDIVIIGAHYDHLGMGSFSSLHRGEPVVHNGADDNASGVAAMIHLARILKEKELNLDYIFIGFSGEEKGLWGSNYFAKNPTVDLAKVNYMINMDMVRRLDKERGLAVNGTGTSPVWNYVLDKANIDSIKLIKSESGVGPSDHTSFYLQDIPVLHFFSGQHEDYHKPGDDVEKVNIEGVLQIASLIERVAIDLDDEEKIEFTKTKDQSSNSPRFTVSLGVIPDYLFDGNGMRIDGVSDDKPAQKAGILKGDIVIQLGDSAVTDMMSYMRALSSFKKGDATTVIINRDGNELSYEIEF